MQKKGKPARQGKIQKLQDGSTYTVRFHDGDIRKLRRGAVKPKGPSSFEDGEVSSASRQPVLVRRHSSTCAQRCPGPQSIRDFPMLPPEEESPAEPSRKRRRLSEASNVSTKEKLIIASSQD